MQLAVRPSIAAGANKESVRHWLTAGVVVASAGAIAVAPGISPIPTHIAHDVEAGAVRLTAGWDPLEAWKAALDTATAGATTLYDNFALAPAVGLQQALVNQAAFLEQVIDDPSSAKAVAQQFVDNAKKVAAGLTLVGLDSTDASDKAILDAVTSHTTAGLHGFLISSLGGFLPDSVDPATVTAVLQLLASPLSGVMIGMVGPAVSPAVALLNSAQAVSDAINAKDASAAFTALLDAPASAVGAFFNGADLHLDGVAALLNSSGALPAGTTIDKLDINFGGLLTPGTTSGKTYEVKDADGNVIKSIPAPGGSILNSLGLTITTDALGAPLTLPIESYPVGPIGALQGLSQTVGVLLGDGWDVWDGKGNPPPPKPPIFGLPSLDDVLSDTAESAGVTKLRDLLKSATVDNLAKKLQGLATEAQGATAAGSSAADSAAAVTELTHATTNKTVAVSVPKAEVSTAVAATDPAPSAGSADENAAATKESAGDTGNTGTTATSASTRHSPSTSTQLNLVKGFKDAVKNARTGVGGNGSRKSSESGSSSSTSSSSASSSKGSGTHRSAKHDAK